MAAAAARVLAATVRRRRVAVPWGAYLRSGWILTAVALAAAALVLPATVR